MDSTLDQPWKAFLERSDRPGILHVIQHHEPSGAEVSHLPLMLADPDPLLACPPGSATERFARERGIPTVPLPYRSLRQSAGRLELMRSALRGIRSALDLRRILREHPDRPIVVGNTLTPSLVASVAATGMSRQPVWIAAQLLPHRALRALIRLFARVGAARIVVPSHAAYSEFVGRSRILGRRTHVAQPGVELDRFRTHRAWDGVQRVALVGYISEVKRTGMALEVALRVAERLPTFELMIVGSAQYTPEDFTLERALRDRVAGDPRLAAHVRFRGYERDVPAFLATVSALLHCCPSETFGMVLVEAMAAGVPVVAPRSGGPLDIVEHETTGLLYPPEDIERAADYLVRLLSNPAEARAMGLAGRARAEERFSGRAYVARFSAAVDGLADA